MARRSSNPTKWKPRRVSSGVTQSSDDAVPQVFREMLDSEALPDASTRHSTKRRRVGYKPGNNSEQNVEDLQPLTDQGDDGPEAQADNAVQTAFDSSDNSDDDLEWEDVNLDTVVPEPIPAVDNISENLSIVVDSGTKIPSPSKRKIRKPLTNAERKMRLNIHKVHFLCLLYHCFI